jgi:hypothetical protein
MKIRRTQLIITGAGLPLASVATVVATVLPAHASPMASIAAYGGPGGIWVSGSGFNAGSTVRSWC